MHTSLKGLAFGIGVVALTGCLGSARSAAPAGVPLQSLVAEKVVLHGTAEATLTSATCTAAAPSKPQHVVELSEDTRAAILLAPAPGQPPLPVSMLHITHLESNRTWCVMTKADGTPAALAAELPQGLYLVSVAEPRTAAPQPYEVTFEKL